MNVGRHLLPHLPYLGALYTLQSFTKAAESLHITQTAMSYQIKQLETKLGSTLVIRQPGSRLRFSADGETLAKTYLQCERQLELAFDSLQHKQGKGTLRLTTSIDFGSIIMPKVLASLQKLAPGLSIQLHSSDQNVNLANEPWDMAIRGQVQAVDNAIFESPIHLLASPEYLQRNGTPESLPSLDAHTVLHRESSSHRSWKALLGHSPHFPRTLTLGNTLGMREAALESLGLVLLPEFVAAKEIKAGRLLTVLPSELARLKVYFYISRIESEQTQSYEALLIKAFANI